LYSTLLYASRVHRSQQVGGSYASSSSSLASSNSRFFQQIAMVSLLGRIPIRAISGVSKEQMAAVASLAADQETVVKPESEVEVVVEEEEKKLITLPTNESSENLLKIRHTVRPFPHVPGYTQKKRLGSQNLSVSGRHHHVFSA
jgi:hypothetical protein